MKEPTNIRCSCDGIRLMDKEYWGRDYTGEPQYHLSCQECGFSEIMPQSRMDRCIYCDSIVA